MLPILRMNAEKALRRVRILRGILGSNYAGNDVRVLANRAVSSDGKVAIGDISIGVQTPRNAELVPVKYIPDVIPQSVLRDLKWIMQKDLLGQDVFLIGPPGPLRRAIALMYLELTQREAEYVSLSRDTTETDLKQRREIRSGTAYYIDQCAVRAATEGRVLILEGVEKAERNVLPVLNNLLENREMQLDDGRFLVAADRYDKLLKVHSEKELDAWKLVRVNERFRVIALGLPVPRYHGNPLDPPLRSRFQARNITSLPFKDQLELIRDVAQNVPQERLSQILSFATTMLSSESTSLGLPDFPVDSLVSAARIQNGVQELSPHGLIHRLYPYDVMLGKEGQIAVKDTLKTFELDQAQDKCTITNVHRKGSRATVEIRSQRKEYNIQVAAGNRSNMDTADNFVKTESHDNLLADMMLSHMVKDFCIIGPKGCGKSVLVRHFADILGYHLEPIMLYQDMTSRDLLQQRTTLPNGDTVWRPSPLVSAAIEGNMAVLDGIHRVNPGTFAVVNRLVQDRELHLFDGSRLLRQDRYEEIKKTSGYTDEQMQERSIYPIHPSFRVVGLAEPPSASGQKWLNSELLPLFMFHHMKPLSRKQETEVLYSIVPNAKNLQPLLDLTHNLRSSADVTSHSLSSSLSTRQLLRCAKRLAQYPDESLYNSVQKACLARFLPRLARSSLDRSLEEVSITQTNSAMSVDEMESALSCEVKDGILRIGKTEVAIGTPDNRMKVPDVLFYENAQHLSIMEDMLKDYLLGEHLLLVGNQGVGKNKIVDRFLHLTNKPREYLQLHRDTTVQSLTLQPTVQDGVIVYEDSPLVRAVKLGHILVVDEADKAPTNVTCILKTLVESGEMHLADGRRIVTDTSGLPPSDDYLVIHPDFRMIVLANRPGFPFLGNDFFGAMGDIFSCHAIDNPNVDSEMDMLRQYGPNVPEDILRKLVLSFGELRELADQGLISYPYSTREVVNMVKHLEKFPSEGLSNVVRNVFDFDSYHNEMKEVIVQTLHKHGIPIGAQPTNVNLAKQLPLPKFEFTESWQIARRGDSRTTKCIAEQRQLKIKGPIRLNVQSYPLERTEARSLSFSEMDAFWTIPMNESNVIADVSVTKGSQNTLKKNDIVHVATANPIAVFTMDPKSQSGTVIDLYDMFPSTHGGFRPQVKLTSLGASLFDTVILHEELSNTILSINTENGEMMKLSTSSLFETAAEKFNRRFTSDQDVFKMCSEFASDPEGLLVFYKQNGHQLDVVEMLSGHSFSIQLPFSIMSVNLVDKYSWLVMDSETQSAHILRRSEDNAADFFLSPLCLDNANQGLSMDSPDIVATQPLNDAVLSEALGEKLSSPNRLMATSKTYATLAVGFPDLESSIDIYTSLRTPPQEQNTQTKVKDSLWSALSPSKPSTPNSQAALAYLPECGQIVKGLPTWKVPEEVFPDKRRPKDVAGYLEVSDIANKVLRYIPVPGSSYSPYTAWLQTVTDCNLIMAPMTNDGLVTVDTGGCVRLWETSPMRLGLSLDQWRNMIGDDPNRPLQMTIEREQSKDVSSPKHGKVDSKNEPHVGGNTWAGGTGGRDTAGLGGKGGPYRLDAGHNVHQLSDAEKEAVPEEVKKAAREMGQKAFKERLREIKMSEYDADLYEKYSKSVRGQVQSLRVILDSLQAKSKERQWLKNQAEGDLDEAKLIEGLAGEKAIYKRRGDHEPELGTQQQKPKRLKVVVDVSGSMYRFNGHDGRLEREMEAVLMVMEAFESYEQKFKYDIVGHSGEDYSVPFVTPDKIPANNKQRLEVLKTMHAHSQFCLSGDYTLEATRDAINTISKEEADEHFVIVLSDANLRRYGISPQKFATILTSDEEVNTFAIFIGSLGDEAHRLTKQLPSGRAFVCMDTKNIPQILQQIFTSTMLSTR